MDVYLWLFFRDQFNLSEDSPAEVKMEYHPYKAEDMNSSGDRSGFLNLVCIGSNS